MNGIITIAVGGKNYGNMAFNLAMSIKHNSKLPVCVLYTPSAFSGSEYLLNVFDSKIEMPDTDEPVKLAMSLKTSLNIHTPFWRTIFLDSDCIMSPTHSADEWFEELKGVPFTAYNNAIYELGGDPYPYYKCWAKPDDIREHYALRTTDKIPQINSSFIYFEQCPDSARIFDEARRLVTGSRLKHEEFRGEFPDELAFNIACCLTGIMPHKQTYRPIYLYILSESVSKEYIIENFPCLSVIGSDIKDKRIIQYYNEFVDYYADIAGVIKKLFWEKKIKDTSERKIIGFYHVCMINHYESVLREQIAEIVGSGLYQATHKINVVLSGDKVNATRVMKILKQYPKFEVNQVADIRQYEFPTIKLVRGESDKDEKNYYYYIHTKGVSFPDHTGGKHWRDYMMYYNVTKWQDCVAKLREGYETCGCKLYEHQKGFPKHYSGNFWWATSDYIKRTPRVEELDHSDRFQAEFWMCKGSPKSASLCQIYIDYDKTPAYK